MQADPGLAALVPGGQLADRIATIDLAAAGDRGRHRLVCGAQPAGMCDAHDPAAGQPTGVSDDTITGGHDHLAGDPAEVHAPVARQPLLCGWLEPVHHDHRLQRPAETLRWRRIRPHRSLVEVPRSGGRSQCRHGDGDDAEGGQQWAKPGHGFMVGWRVRIGQSSMSCLWKKTPMWRTYSGPTPGFAVRDWRACQVRTGCSFAHHR